MHAVTYRLKLPGCRIQYFLHSSVSMIPSHVVYGGTGAALVDNCYIYSLLLSHHLLGSDKHVNLKIWLTQSCCYNLFSALLIPLPVSCLKYNILVPRSGMSLPCQEEEHVSCRKAHPKNTVSNKGTPAYNCLPLYKKENSCPLWK